MIRNSIDVSAPPPQAEDDAIDTDARRTDPNDPAGAPPDGHAGHHTVWGLEANQLHDRFWAARGVQVVRLGEPTELAGDAELFLLIDTDSLVIFRVGQLVDTLNWLRPRVLLLRLHDTRDHGYRERVITDHDDRFLGFQRLYGGADCHLNRVALTSDPQLALNWQRETDLRKSWRELRRGIPQNQRATASVNGGVYDRHYTDEVDRFVRELVQTWRRPDVTIRRARRITPGVWGDIDARPNGQVRFIAPVWIGAGRKFDGIDSVVGPAVLWDRPEDRPVVEDIRWEEIEAADSRARPPVKPPRMSSLQRINKRAFDTAFALLVLLVTLPFYPLIFLAIWLEDGSPFFFAHRRETMGGREFPCLKFRTMKKDAELIKADLAHANRADGPQFFIDDDPRITRVGRFMRKYNIDELPQFFNVLLGQMSIVGPRPSPYSENQYCPPWRETRLSVRPGITGLWQVLRSREEGLDFQEWIRFDIQYVEHPSWKMDLWIIGQTIRILLGKHR